MNKKKISLTYPQQIPLPRYALVIIILIMIPTYVVMSDKYSTFHVDDPWTLSFDYYYMQEGYEFDRISGDGAAVLAYFGKTHAFIYGTWAKLFGWGRFPARLLSSIFIFAAAILWGASAARLFGKQSAGWMVFLFSILFDIFVSIGTRVRPEALIMFFCAVAMHLFLRKHYMLSGICSALAVEIHPMGIAGFIILFSVIFAQHGREIFSRSSLRRIVLPVILGICIGSMYYLLLHYQHLGSISSRSGYMHDQSYYPFSFLTAHFLDANYYRHIPDLILALVGYVWLLIRWRSLEEYRVPARFALCVGLAVVLLSLLIPRSNENYACFLYPGTVVLYTIFALYYKRSFLILVATVLFVLPQYGYLAWSLRNMNFNEYIGLVREHLPATDVLFVGHPVYWFAVVEDPNHEFYSTKHPELPVKGRVYYRIYSDHPIDVLHAALSPAEKELQSMGRVESYSSFTYDNIQVHIDRIDYRQ